jgi:ketosteroid isomerase-like protein
VSEGDLEIVRRTIEAFNRDGVEAAIQYLDADIDWVAPPEWLEEPVYKGHDGIRRIASQWTENFDQYRLDLEELIDAGDRVLALSCSGVGSRKAGTRSSSALAMSGRCETERARASRSTSPGSKRAKRRGCLPEPSPSRRNRSLEAHQVTLAE